MSTPTRTRSLTGTGWITWEEARRVLDGATCLWVDLGGVHEGSVPLQPPTATHLWAWRGDVAFRARIDEGLAVVATLSPAADIPNAASEFDVIVRDAGTWAEPHVRVGQLAGRQWRLLEVIDSTSMQFLTPTHTSPDR